MPLRNSQFRVVHRTKQDPHGVEGYFIHELYVRADGTVSGWRAGISAGAKTPVELRGVIQQIQRALDLPVIEHKDLRDGKVQLPREATIQVIDPHRELGMHRP